MRICSSTKFYGAKISIFSQFYVKLDLEFNDPLNYVMWNLPKIINYYDDWQLISNITFNVNKAFLSYLYKKTHLSLQHVEEKRKQFHHIRRRERYECVSTIKVQ